ncbi:MAG: hypothetical protein R3C58_08975 [Parvularculaceae bacterium]
MRKILFRIANVALAGMSLAVSTYLYLFVVVEWLNTTFHLQKWPFSGDALLLIFGLGILTPHLWWLSKHLFKR